MSRHPLHGGTWSRRPQARTYSHAAVLGLIIAVALVATPPAAAGQGLEDAIVVSFDVDTLRLASGETGTLSLDICNTADVPLQVDVDFIAVDAPGSCVGTLSDEMFLLAPGEARRVLVTVESRAHRNQDPDISDFEVRVAWGRNATGDTIDDPVDGRWDREFDVVNVEPAWADWMVPVLFIVLIVVVGVVLFLASRDRRKRIPEGHLGYPPVHQNRKV